MATDHKIGIAIFGPTWGPVTVRYSIVTDRMFGADCHSMCMPPRSCLYGIVTSVSRSVCQLNGLCEFSYLFMFIART
jgi:hypothetical protein